MFYIKYYQDGSISIPPPAPMSMQGDVAQNWKDFETECDHHVIVTQLVKKLKKENGQPDEDGMLQVGDYMEV